MENISTNLVVEKNKESENIKMEEMEEKLLKENIDDTYSKGLQ